MEERTATNMDVDLSRQGLIVLSPDPEGHCANVLAINDYALPCHRR